MNVQVSERLQEPWILKRKSGTHSRGMLLLHNKA
jgi:hypothetical protein